MSTINHQSPEKSGRKKANRSSELSAGFEWNGFMWQTAPQDRANIAGRVSKLMALMLLGKVTLLSDTYPSSQGGQRPLIWRTLNDQMVTFTVQEFLEFGIAVDEFVEDKYIESWQ